MELPQVLAQPNPLSQALILSKDSSSSSKACLSKANLSRASLSRASSHTTSLSTFNPSTDSHHTLSLCMARPRFFRLCSLSCSSHLLLFSTVLSSSHKYRTWCSTHHRYLRICCPHWPRLVPVQHPCFRHSCSKQPHPITLLSRYNQPSGDLQVSSLNKCLVFLVLASLGATRTMVLSFRFQASCNRILILQLYLDKLTSSSHQLSFTLISSRQPKVTPV